VELQRLDLADRDAAEAALAVQRRAYRVEADLVGFDAIPPLHESLADLQAADETFLAATVDGQLAGLVSWKRDGETLDLHRLAVDPRFFRAGIGRALVRAAEAAEEGASRVIVQTGAANEPAKALYRSEGFREIGEREVAPGFRVTLFEKVRSQAATP
jgi:ribosomal protein S18 acetylase RimI-like enzyme